MNVSSPSETTPLLARDEGPTFTTEQQRDIFDKLARRVVLLCMGIVFVSYMDRGNVSLAANEICKDLHLTHSQYGTMIAVFQAGYISSQLISNAMLKRFGAPVWLAFIICTWGCIATASAFVRSLPELYVFRVLLGVAEGGTFPGAYYYLGLFFPDGYVEEAYAGLNAAASLSVPLSSLLAAGLLSKDGWIGTRGWRNLLFVEGLIPIAYSIVLYCYLPRSLETASFLTEGERRWLMGRRREQESRSMSHFFAEISEISRSFDFWRLASSMSLFLGNYTVMISWITLIIHDSLGDNDERDSKYCGSGGNSVAAVALTAVPFALNSFVCLSIRTRTRWIRNRTGFVALMQLACGMLMITWIWTRKLTFVFGFLSLTSTVALLSVPNIFVAGVVLSVFSTELRSSAIAIMNGMASLLSMGFSIAVGHIVDGYGYGHAVLLCSVTTAMAVLLSFSVRDPILQRERYREEGRGVDSNGLRC